VHLGGGTYAIFSYLLEFFNMLGLMTEWELPLHATHIQILGVRKERIICTTVCKKKQPTNWFVLDVLLIMCTTLFSLVLAAYQLILAHSQEKKLPALSHLCKSPCSYHPSFPPQSDKNFFMCHSECGEAEHKCTWREMWNKLLLKLEHRNSKAFFYICCERSARSVRGNGSNYPHFLRLPS